MEGAEGGVVVWWRGRFVLRSSSLRFNFAYLLLYFCSWETIKPNAGSHAEPFFYLGDIKSLLT